MPIPGSGSTLANAFQRKRGLAKVREGLLDRPGVPRRGGPPPPTAPAQDRTSPQEQALEQPQPQPMAAPQDEVTPEQPPIQQESPLGLDPEVRQELLEQITPFLQDYRKQKRAKLHARLGRARKFFGGGV